MLGQQPKQMLHGWERSAAPMMLKIFHAEGLLLLGKSHLLQTLS